MSGYAGHQGVAVELSPTYTGFIGDTVDACFLFEAVINGHFPHVPRRPHDRERDGVVVSGNVFIYEEGASGIKRWTDGISWSPSRILGNFLIYRQLDKAFLPGTKKKALAKSARVKGGVSKNGTHSNSRGSQILSGLPAHHNSYNGRMTDHADMNADQERALIGSLTDSYIFRDGGLVKKTISIEYNGQTHHMVSYYSIEDAREKRLMRPSKDPSLTRFYPRKDLLTGQGFKVAIDQENNGDHVDQDLNGPNRYANTNQGIQSYGQPQQYGTGNYAIPVAESSYGSQNPDSYSPAAYVNGQYQQASQTPLNGTTYAPSHVLPPPTGTYTRADMGSQLTYNQHTQRYDANDSANMDGSRVQMPVQGENRRRSSDVTSNGSNNYTHTQSSNNGMNIQGMNGGGSGIDNLYNHQQPRATVNQYQGDGVSPGYQSAMPTALWNRTLSARPAQSHYRPNGLNQSLTPTTLQAIDFMQLPPIGHQTQSLNTDRTARPGQQMTQTDQSVDPNPRIARYTQQMRSTHNLPTGNQHQQAYMQQLQPPSDPEVGQ